MDGGAAVTQSVLRERGEQLLEPELVKDWKPPSFPLPLFFCHCPRTTTTLLPRRPQQQQQWYMCVCCVVRPPPSSPLKNSPPPQQPHTHTTTVLLLLLLLWFGPTRTTDSLCCAAAPGLLIFHASASRVSASSSSSSSSPHAHTQRAHTHTQQNQDAGICVFGMWRVHRAHKDMGPRRRMFPPLFHGKPRNLTMTTTCSEVAYAERTESPSSPISLAQDAKVCCARGRESERADEDKPVTATRKPDEEKESETARTKLRRWRTSRPPEYTFKCSLNQAGGSCYTIEIAVRCQIGNLPLYIMYGLGLFYSVDYPEVRRAKSH